MPKGAVIVDVGGGTGALARLLLPQYPDMRFIVQESQHVVDQAKQTADAEMSNWIKSGAVVFEEQDMFKPQPNTRQGSVFVLKNIL